MATTHNDCVPEYHRKALADQIRGHICLINTLLRKAGTYNMQVEIVEEDLEFEKGCKQVQVKQIRADITMNY